MTEITIFFLALFGFVAAIFLFLKPRINLYLIIFFSIFDLGYFSRWFGLTRFFARIPFFLVIILSFSLVLGFLSKKLNFPNKAILLKATVTFFLSLSFISLISIFVNYEDVLLGLFEIRNFYFLTVICVAFYIYRPFFVSDRKIVQFVALIGLVQIPFTIVQNYMIRGFRIELARSPLDASSGTFGGYPALVFLQCIAIGVTLMYQLRKDRPIFKINNYSLIILLVIPIVFSFSRSATGFIPFIIMVVFIREIYIQRKTQFMFKTVIPIFIILIIIVFSFYQYFWKQHFKIEEQFNADYLIDYFFHRATEYGIPSHIENQMGRGRAILESTKIISKSFGTFLFGLGSGATSEAEFINRKGRHFFEFGSDAGLGRNQYSKIIAELGFFGFALFILFFINISKQIKKAAVGTEKSLHYDIYFIVLICIVILSFYDRIFNGNIVLLVLGLIISSSQITLIAHLQKS